MGITGLLPALFNAQRPVHLEELRGKRMGIDASIWQVKAAYNASTLQTAKRKCVVYFIKYIKLLHEYDIQMTFVLDGEQLPAKKPTYEKRAENRKKIQQTIIKLKSEGKESEALTLMASLNLWRENLSVTLIKLLSQMGITFIVSPYESDATLAYLARKKIIDIVVTEDSDLIVYECPLVLYKLKSTGHGLLYDKKLLKLCPEHIPISKSFEKFRLMCIIAGCDYSPSLKGIGLVKAKQIVDNGGKSLQAMLKSIPHLFPQVKKPTKEYYELVTRANETFLYHIVWDPVKKTRIPITPYPKGLSADDFSFAGSIIDDKMAMDMAEGIVIGFKNRQIVNPFESLELLEFDTRPIDDKSSPGIQIPRLRHLQCSTCKKEFLYISQFEHHSRTVHKRTHPFKCSFPSITNESICQKRYKCMHHLQVHIKTIHSGCVRVTCEICQVEFSHQRSLNSHKRYVHTALTSKFKCTVCNREYKYIRSLKLHIKAKHSEISGPEKLKCEYCDAKFSYERNLNAHKRLRHIVLIPKFKCTVCGNEYEHKQSLKTHIAQKHSGADPTVICQICGKKLANEVNLYAHKRFVHTVMPKVICTVCSNEYKTNDSLTLHMKQKHSELVVIVKCEICGLEFTNPRWLNGHMKTNHFDMITKPKCTICNREYFSKHVLKKHMLRKHNASAIGHKCEVCSRVLASKYNLKLHMMLKHNQNPNGSAVEHKCEVCNKVFATKSNLNLHMMRKHSQNVN